MGARREPRLAHCLLSERRLDLSQLASYPLLHFRVLCRSGGPADSS